MMPRLDFAPLDGITKVVFRRVCTALRRCGPVFHSLLSPTDQHILTQRDRRELDPEANGGLPLVPQVMTRRAPDFLWAAELVEQMGYQEVNLNLGCPSGTVTAKGKGSGFLADPDGLDRFFDEVFSHVHLPVSVKTRLGIQDPAEFSRLMEIYNRYPIACLTIHPRVQKEKYRGPVHRDVFYEALCQSRNPVCYNGDLRTVEEVESLAPRDPGSECSHDRAGAQWRIPLCCASFAAALLPPGKSSWPLPGNSINLTRTSTAGCHSLPADEGSLVLSHPPV